LGLNFYANYFLRSFAKKNMAHTGAVSENLQELYDNYYAPEIDTWREIGAIQKAENILDVVGKHRFGNLLEWGAGNGALLHKLAQTGIASEFYAAEISESGIKQIEHRQIPMLKTAIVFDGYSLPYPDKFFDVVVLSHVLEHVEHQRMLLREIRRVAKNLIIEVPRDYKSGVDIKAQSLFDYGHINVYTPSLLRFLLKSERFELVADKMSFSSDALLLFAAQARSKFLVKIRIKLYTLLRDFAYRISPYWRKETMINAYTIWCKTDSTN
jgi:SAM-dependent methyltransferase